MRHLQCVMPWKLYWVRKLRWQVILVNVSMSDLIGQWLAQYRNKRDETEFSWRYPSPFSIEWVTKWKGSLKKEAGTGKLPCQTMDTGIVKPSWDAHHFSFSYAFEPIAVLGEHCYSDWNERCIDHIHNSFLSDCYNVQLSTNNEQQRIVP